MRKLANSLSPNAPSTSVQTSSGTRVSETSVTASVSSSAARSSAETKGDSRQAFRA